MNVKKLLEKMGSIICNPDLRAGFFQHMISSLAVEAEILFPDRRRPGPEYDQAIGNLSAIVRAKGKIHAYYNLYCRWSVVPGRKDDLTGEDDLALFEKVFDELEQNLEIKERVYDIASAGLRQMMKRVA